MTKPRGIRRAFDPEFKREAVRLWEERRAAGVPISRVAKELGIRPNQLRDWVTQVGSEGATPRAGESVEQEVRRLRRENARLRQEAEFAKKAAAYFARESH